MLFRSYNLNNPEKFVDSPFSQILLDPKDKVWDEQFISRHNAWNFVNFLSYLGMQSPNITWESNLNFTPKDVLVVQFEVHLIGANDAVAPVDVDVISFTHINSLTG